jgi:hypothetical protein
MDPQDIAFYLLCGLAAAFVAVAVYARCAMREESRRVPQPRSRDTCGGPDDVG